MSPTNLSILVLQYSASSPAGLIGECIVEAGGRQIVHQFECKADDHIIDGRFDGLLLLGGAQHAGNSDDHPYFDHHMSLIRHFHRSAKPVLGLCLGAQLIARAFGRRVYRQQSTEFGFVPISFNPAGCVDPLVGGLGKTVHFMAWHEDTFEIPEHATLLANSTQCHTQAFRIDECVYGLQFHPEVNRQIARKWASLPEATVANGGVDSVSRCEADLGIYYADTARAAKTIGRRWINLVERCRLSGSELQI